MKIQKTVDYHKAVGEGRVLILAAAVCGKAQK
jgi:hypothetical protein